MTKKQPEGEPRTAPPKAGSFGDAAAEMANETEVEEQVTGDTVAGDAPGTAEERPSDDVDTEEDAQRRQSVETRNQADQLVYTTEKFLADNSEKLPEDVKTEVQADVDALKVILENAEASAEELQAGITKLGESSQKMGAAMYAAAEADAAAAGGSDGSTGEADDDVVDAEIVDEGPTDEDDK